MNDTTRRGLFGILILIGAMLFCWGDVALGQAHAEGWIAGVIGPERAQANAPLVETLFSLIVFAPLFALALGAARLEHRNALALGVRPGAAAVVGVAAGVTGLTVATYYAWLANGLVDGDAMPARPAMLLWGLCIVGMQTLAEETYFRGWLQPALTRRWGWAAGIVAGALAFAALHIAGGARGPISLLNLFLGGLMFGLFAARGGGIAAAAAAHCAWNATEQLVWGLDPNPGIGSFGAIWNKELVGRAIWGGSPDGLNGSAGMTLAVVAILIPLAALSWRRLPLARPATFSPSGSPG